MHLGSDSSQPVGTLACNIMRAGGEIELQSRSFCQRRNSLKNSGLVRERWTCVYYLDMFKAESDQPIYPAELRVAGRKVIDQIGLWLLFVFGRRPGD